MNTVTPQNFNQTMDGYNARAWKEAGKNLQEKGYTVEQVEEMQHVFNNAMRWAKDELAMEEARKIKG